MTQPDHITASGQGSVAFSGDGNDVSVHNHYPAGEPLDQVIGIPPRIGDGFVGREWLLDDLDHLLLTDGYVLLEGDAGWGKTALLGWLARTRGYPAHFLRYGRDQSATEVWRSLGAQLIRDHNLEEFAPGGRLPPTAGSATWFCRVLAQAQQALPGTQRLVLVLDGLDEFQAREAGGALVLPSDLPARVTFVVSARTGLDLSGAINRGLHLRTDDDRNLNDIRRYLLQAVEQSTELRDALGDTDAGDFADALIERCRGVWVYVRYVLDDIRAGRRSATQIGELPDGLWRYYAQTLERLRAGTDWDRCLSLLATLAVTADPLPDDSLARFAHIELDLVEDLLEGPLRPFCTVTEASHGPVTYVIYHATFRDFLLGSEPAAHVPPLHDTSQARRLRRALSRAAQEADQRVVTRYLTAWGGLEAGLPTLDAQPALLELDGAYGCRWLLSHMLYSDQASALHRLLSLETPQEGGRQHNLWFRVHHERDKIGDYFNDVITAYRCARAETDSRHAKELPAPSIGQELRYLLIQASLVAVADHLPVGAVNELVRSGKWPLERALEYAGLSTDEASIGELLSLLARTLADSVRPANLVNDSRLLELLSWPAPPAFTATERDWIRLLNAAREVREPYVRAHTLCGMASDLPGELPGQVMREAYESALKIAGNSRRSIMLRLVATHAEGRAPDLGSRAWRAAVEAAATSDHTLRSHDLRELATDPRLPSDLCPVVLDAMATIEDPTQRMEAFASASCFLSGSAQSHALRELTRTIRAVDDEDKQASLLESAQQWLHDPISRLPRAESDFWHEAALDLVSALKDEALRERTLRMVSVSAPPALTPRLYEVAQTMKDPAHRAAASQLLISVLPNGQADQAWKAAVAAVAAIEDHTQQAITLMGLLTASPDDRRRDLKGTPLANAHPYLEAPIAGAARYGRLAAEEPHDHADQSIHSTWRRTIDAVVALPDGELLTDVVLFLWSWLPNSWTSAVLDRLAAIGDQETAARTLSLIASGWCPTSVRDHLIALASRFPDGQHESWVLANLAKHSTPRPSQPELSARAINAVLRVEDPLRRARVLTAHLADRGRLDEETQVLACAEALKATAEVPDETERAHLLFGLRDSLTDDLRSAALALAKRLTDPERRARTLYWLAPRPWANGSPENELVPSLNDHDAIATCVDNLSAGVGRGHPGRPPRRWSNTRAALVTVHGVILRWPGFAMDPADAESQPNGPRNDQDDPQGSQNALSRTLSDLEASTSRALVTPREELLKWLSTATDHILAEGGQDAITETLQAVKDVGRWWP